jgi:exonuclease III
MVSTYLNSKSQKGVADVKYYLIIYNQNIQGSKSKLNEFMITLSEIKPHVICISEHHLNNSYLNMSHIPSYRLGANYCRTTLKCGGTCIFVHEDVHFSNINLSEHCMERDLEITALKVTFKKKSFIILCLYRAPSGDLEYFLDHLEEILLSLYKPKIQFILCGDFNIDFS